MTLNSVALGRWYVGAASNIELGCPTRGADEASGRRDGVDRPRHENL